MGGINGYSVGKDLTLNINTPNGPMRISTITGFRSGPNVVKGGIRGLDGIRRPLIFPDGWNGSFDVARRDSTLDDFWALVEAGYYAGEGIPSNTITQTITEADGSVNQYKYLGVSLVLTDAGDWAGDKEVNQHLEFEAQTRIKVA